MSLREILVRIARTAALALTGAAALLLALYLADTVPNGHLLIVIALAAPFGALLGWATLQALRSGEFPHRFGVDRRDRSPAVFWASIAIFAATAAGMAALSLHALLQLIAGPVT